MRARQAGPKRRARAVLLWAAGLFAAVQLTASLLLDYAWPLLRFPSARRTMAALAAEPGPPEIVALGSSRFGAGIAPHEIGALLGRQLDAGRPVGVFNAAAPAGDSIAAEFLLRRLLRAGVRPKLVLLEISPETLNYYNEWLGLHVRRQLCWHDLPGYFVEVCWSKQMARWLGERASPLYYHREELWRRAAEAAERFAAGPAAGGAAPPRPGLTGGPPAWGELLRLPGQALTPQLAQASVEGASIGPSRWLRHYRIGGANAEALERLLGRCKRRGIEVVLIGAPVTRPHRETYTPAILGEYQAYLDRVAQQYGAAFHDYRDRLPDNLFLDCHHLSPEGGVYFSRLLTYELLAPRWQAQRDRPVAREK
jgi:hypothetical protein